MSAERDGTRPPLEAVKAAARAIGVGVEAGRTSGAIAWAALGDAYPAIRRHVIEGLLEEVATEIGYRAEALADEFDPDAAYALGEDLDGLADVRTWLRGTLAAAVDGRRVPGKR